MDDKVWIKDGRKPFRLFHKKVFPNPDANSIMPDVRPDESERSGAMTTFAVFLPPQNMI
jgi:hypothetical protein